MTEDEAEPEGLICQLVEWCDDETSATLLANGSTVEHCSSCRAPIFVAASGQLTLLERICLRCAMLDPEVKVLNRVTTLQLVDIADGLGLPLDEVTAQARAAGWEVVEQ